MINLLIDVVITCFILQQEYLRFVFAHKADDVQFYYYSTEDSYEKIDLEKLDSLKAGGDGPLFVVIDGFLSSFETSMSQRVKNELIHHRPNGKVIVVDWAQLSGFHSMQLKDNTRFDQFMLVYNLAKSKVGIVGKAIAQLVATLVEKKVTEYPKVHLIGYSLGAHVAGIAGMTVIENSNGMISRITGLDPAGPGFPLSKPLNRLDKSDAEFVDVYFTNRYLAGDREQHIGHVDVYVNGGKSDQPGCASPNLINSTICNHSFSWKAWNKCLNEKCVACPCYAAECQNCSGSCKDGETVGLDISLNLTGDFYLELRSLH